MSTLLGNPADSRQLDNRARLAELLREKKHRTAPLSSAQQRLWFLSQLEPDSYAYNIVGGLRLEGRLDVSALDKSLKELVRRHETLRTSIAMVDGVPVQLISAPAGIALSSVDLTGPDREEAELELERQAARLLRCPFDLTRGPFLRVTLFTLSDVEHVLLLITHHIVSDGWSIGVLRKELASLYDAFSAGLPSPLNELPIQYADYARWQAKWLEGDEVKKQLAFWKTNLAGIPTALDLPFDKPRPMLQSSAGDSVGIFLSEQSSYAVRTLSRREGVTPFTILLAAFKVLLWRYSGQEDIVVGTPTAGRANPETEGLIGMFVNTVAVRTELGADSTFRELLGDVKESCLEAFAHQDAPFERIVEEQNTERDLSRSPIFQTMFILQVPMADMRLSNLKIKEWVLNPGIARFELTLFLQETGQQFAGFFEYNTDLFERATIERMKGHYEKLLEGMVRNPEERIGSLDLLGEEEKRQVLDEWNATDREYEGPSCTPGMIEEQARLFPKAVAVVYEQQRVSYDELNRRANQVARRLRRMGVGPEHLVGVCLERSADIAVALLGVWKAGAAYVPVDPGYPDERVKFMLEDSEARVLITQDRLRGRWKQYSGQLLCLDGESQSLEREPKENFTSGAGPENLAYVIYTSGSTGQPKGVMISHGALANFLRSMQEQPGLGRGDVLLAVTTLSFDIAGLELHLPLVSGACVEVVSREVAIDGQRLAAKIQHSGATVMQATPVTWRMLIETGWTGASNLKILCGGEALPRELARELLPRCGQLWNLYGPTETTIWSTLWRVESGSGPVLIGRPVANTTVYILDSSGQPVPAGVAGELHIGGSGLARGYLKRAELTAQKFIANPIPGRAHERIYRTGDLARFRADGQIECLGRLDHQVKLRGHRIELGEIEAVLRQQEHIREAVVVARIDSPGDARLVAYVEALPEVFSAERLRAGLKDRLPEYMIPSAIVVLNKLPLTNNGKVNRNALPAPGLESLVPASTYVEPRSERESQLVELWEEILGKKPIGINDDFFALGGHSMLAVRLFTRIEKITGHHLPLAMLFQSSTIKELAQAIDGEQWHSGWSPAVILNRGTSTPFFCIHSLGANLVSYKKLAELLGNEQPFYGLQPHGLDGKEEPLDRVEDMAAAYIREIRAIQPEGPYMLGGVCMGGVVAFEMAHQLKHVGQEVSVLLAIDSAMPGPSKYLYPRPYNLMLADWHLGMLFRLPWPEKIGYVANKFVNLGHRIISLLSPRQEEGSLQRSVRKLSEVHLKALGAYRPRPYSGRMTLLWCSDTPSRSYEDSRLAWSEFVEQGLEVHVIPGNHMTMIDEPHVRVLAARVGRLLARSRAATS